MRRPSWVTYSNGRRAPGASARLHRCRSSTAAAARPGFRTPAASSMSRWRATASRCSSPSRTSRTRSPRRAAQRAAQPAPGPAGALGSVPEHGGARPGAGRRLELDRKDHKMGKLEGKVAVITGGNSGIGLATAKEFAEQGASIVVSGRDQKTLDEAARELGRDALVVRADVAKLAEIDKLFAVIKARFGRIDVLFVNAGIGKFAPLEAVTEELY